MSDEECVVTGITASAITTAIALVAVFDIGLREIPTLISKFRVFVLLMCLSRAVIYVTQHQSIPQTQGVVLLQAWSSFMSLVFGLCTTLYFLENFVVAWSALANDRTKSLTSAARSANSILRCWIWLRIFFLLFCLVLGIMFTLQPINRIFIVFEIGGIIGWATSILPMCVVTTRLAILLRRYRLELTENGDVTQSMAGAKSKLSRLRFVQHQLLGFVLACLIVCGVSVTSGIKSTQLLVRDPLALWRQEYCVNSEIGGIIGRYLLMIIGLALTPAPHAPRRTKCAGKRSSSSSGRIKTADSLSDGLSSNSQRKRRRSSIHRECFSKSGQKIEVPRQTSFVSRNSSFRGSEVNITPCITRSDYVPNETIPADGSLEYDCIQSKRVSTVQEDGCVSLASVTTARSTVRGQGEVSATHVVEEIDV